jgi:mannose-6-phosphate isomerase-like protein (cupin superfamily)
MHTYMIELLARQHETELRRSAHRQDLHVPGRRRYRRRSVRHRAGWTLVTIGLALARRSAMPDPRAEGRAAPLQKTRPAQNRRAPADRERQNLASVAPRIVNVDMMLSRFTDHWSPKKIAQINDYDVRIVKAHGEFTWHTHPDTDEFFMVLDGELTIHMRAGDVALRPRELFVVPRGVEHCPSADAEAVVLLLEPSTVVNTGDAGGELTAEVRTVT